MFIRNWRSCVSRAPSAVAPCSGASSPNFTTRFCTLRALWSFGVACTFARLSACHRSCSGLLVTDLDATKPWSLCTMKVLAKRS